MFRDLEREAVVAAIRDDGESRTNKGAKKHV